MMMANMALQMSQQSPPGMFNLEALNRTILQAANMPNLEDILPPKVEPKPLDPVSDIMAATKGIPIAAFPGQNHEAHITTKMTYLQDPKNGANPIMKRIAPILEANIQEHSVMQYQEQVNGVAQQAMQQVPPEQQQDPSVVEMVMAQAAQQVMNANQAAGMAQSPEQQLVALEQAKVELQKQKLQSDTVVQAAEMELKEKQLELDENKQIIDMLESGASDNFKKEKAQLDRDSRKELKSMDALSKLAVEEEKQESENNRTKERLLKDIITDMKKDEKDMDTKNLEALVNLTIAKYNKERI
tara:strand:- start:146 stop:1045 length:900 start_codon:yes stop_codon:yes gene_type:complete